MLSQKSPIDDMGKIRAFYRRAANTLPEKTLMNEALAINTEGYYNDLIYEVGFRSSDYDTHMMNHLNRLHLLAVEFNNHPKKKETIEIILKGLKYWNDHPIEENNWWYNQIGFLQGLVNIIALVREELPHELIHSLLLNAQNLTDEDITRYGKGANLLDEVYILIGVSSLLDSPQNISNLRRHFLHSLSSEKYIQGDGSFHEHGSQMHMSSYGMVYSSSAVKISRALYGTQWEFSLDELSNLKNFINKGQMLSQQQGVWDFSVVGRGISRPDYVCVKDYYTQLDYLREMNIELEEKGVGNYYFDKSMFMIHKFQGLHFSVRLCSDKNPETEHGNGENIKGNYLSYGGTCIMRDGEEYHSVFPLWNWKLIPGTTCVQDTIFPSRKKWGNNYYEKNSVGGWSNGSSGIMVFKLDKDGVYGHKSWFCFGRYGDLLRVPVRGWK